MNLFCSLFLWILPLQLSIHIPPSRLLLFLLLVDFQFVSTSESHDTMPVIAPNSSLDVLYLQYLAASSTLLPTSGIYRNTTTVFELKLAPTLSFSSQAESSHLVTSSLVVLSLEEEANKTAKQSKQRFARLIYVNFNSTICQLSHEA
jgi:hypothetical protein